MKTQTHTKTAAAQPENAPNIVEVVANELADAFEYDKRNNGDSFAKIKDDAPVWTRRDGSSGECLMLRVHKAIDDRLPNDWIYDKAAAIASSLSEYDSLEAMRDAVSEIADGEVDIYNADRSAWLASHLNNAFLVDDAVKELGQSEQGTFGNIGIGQYVACERIAYALIEEIENEVENRTA